MARAHRPNQSVSCGGGGARVASGAEFVRAANKKLLRIFEYHLLAAYSNEILFMLRAVHEKNARVRARLVQVQLRV